MSIQNVKNISHVRLLFLQPGLFFRKFMAKCRVLAGDFFVDGPTGALIRHNRKVWKDWVDPGASKIVLIDWHSLPVWNIPGLFFANVLARKKKARIVSFSDRPWSLARAVHRLYYSFNVTEHLATGRMTGAQKARRDKIYGEIIGGLKTKADVFALRVNGYHLGLDIYESYLKEFGKPTVYIDDALRAVTRSAIGLMVYWEDYFSSHDVAGVVISHDCYVQFNVVCRVAYKRGVPVYLPTGAYVSHMKAHHDARGYFYSFKTWFADLNEAEKTQARAVARQQMEKRFSGEVTEDMRRIGEVKNAAFQKNNRVHSVLKPSDKIKVLICSHCFFDNPHAYGGMIFLDFYEWIGFLVKIADKTDYDWYLKTHANPLPGTMETVNELLAGSRIKLIPAKTNHHQLIEEGIDFVLTVFGTVGHEYPAFGVQVINAGYNPHVAYDFTRTPKSLEEYERWLLNLGNLKNNINMEEMYEFYFMYYYYSLVDDLIYHSFRDSVLNFNYAQNTSSDAYAFYLNKWDEQRHQESIRRIERFIDSGKQQLFLKGPVNMRRNEVQVAYLS